MNSATLAIGFSLGALLVGAGLALRREDSAASTPSRGFHPDELPNFGELSREPRERIIRDAMLLATELSRVDDYIAPTEVDSIRDFILSHVVPNQVGEITEAMRVGMSQPATPTAVAEACGRIRDGYDLQHRELVAHFLVHVAHADGLLCPEEQAYLQRVVKDIGVAERNLQTMMMAYGNWVQSRQS